MTSQLDRWEDESNRSDGLTVNEPPAQDVLVTLTPAQVSQIDSGLFEFAPDAILVVNSEGRILKANPQAATMFGYPREELIEIEVEKLVPQRFRTNHAGLRQGYSGNPHARRMGAQQDLWAVRKDGSEFAVEVALGPQQVDGKLAVLCVIRDVTDRLRSKEALQRANDELERRVQERTSELSSANAKLTSYADQLERSNRELQDFAYVASHDLQEPLRKIQAFGDRLQSGVQLDEKHGDYLQRMINAAGRMQSLINDLLTFSRIGTRAQPFQRVDLAAVAREVLDDLVVRIEETHAKIDVGPLPSVEGDPMQMRQLLQNLIGNALKFGDPTRDHVVRIHGKTLVHDGERGLVEITVEDNGIGFEPKYAERIFGLFQRLHGRGEYPGSGVGLAICRKIVERHAGRITALGRPGAGSTFVVVLPASREGDKS